MSKRIRILCASLFVSSCSVFAYHPFVDGAEVVLDVSLVDDFREPLPGVEVKINMAGSKEKTNHYTATTDKNGRTSVTCNTIGSGWILVSKDGFYDSEQRIQLRSEKGFSKEWAEKRHQWMNGAVPLKVVLKKIRRPVKLVRHGEYKHGLSYPATNVVMGLDLMKYEWCPPYGNGQVDDLQVKYCFSVNPTDRYQYKSSIEVSMTNRVDGFYWMPVDGTSELHYVHQANTNAVYRKHLAFRYERERFKVLLNEVPPEDKFLVFRFRTELDDQGNLVSAHYGYMPEPIDYEGTFEFLPRFNPIVNDTSLEDVARKPKPRRRNR